MINEISCDRCPAELPEDFFGVAYIADGDSVERICSDCHDMEGAETAKQYRKLLVEAGKSELVEYYDKLVAKYSHLP